MPILLRSAELEVLFESLSRKYAQPDIQEQLVKKVEPIVGLTAQRFPLYLREDVQQDLRMVFCQRLPKLVSEYQKGIKDLVSYLFKFFSNEGKHCMEEYMRVETKYVRIDDLMIEPVVYPKTYEKSKIIQKIRKALEAFYKNRYPEDRHSKNQAERASRFAFVILQGKRPSMDTMVLREFFGGHPRQAEQAYSIALLIIRKLIERHREEIECLLEES